MFFRLRGSVVLWGGRNTVNKYYWSVLTVIQLHWDCLRSRRVCFPSLHCLDSRLLRRELSDVGLGLLALSRSKPLRFRVWATPQRCRLGWACVFRRSHVRAAQVTRCLARVVAPSWRLRLIPSLVPAAQFSGCTTGAHSQVCRVSILGSGSLAANLLADVDHPESQEVLVSNEVCLQFGTGCLSGVWIAPFRLWLPSSACLQRGMGRSAAG